MPKLLFAGGRLDSVTVITGAPVETTTGGRFDAAYADCAISNTNTDTIQATFLNTSGAAVDVVTGETLYAHFEHRAGTGAVTVGAQLATLVDASGQPWVAIRSVSTNLLGLYYNSGTGASPVWTLVGSTFSFDSTAIFTYDIKLTLGSPHSVEVSRNQNAVATGTFTQASLTALSALRIGSNNTGNVSHFSQIMAAEGISTINGKVRYSRGTGAGANSGWVGSVTDVNEAVNNDVTVNSALTAGLRQTYAMGDVTVPAGLAIKGVFHWMRAKNDGIAPLNLKSVIRSAGTDYLGSNVSGMGTSFAQFATRWDNNPATSTPWTQATWNAAEAGFESAT